MKIKKMPSLGGHAPTFPGKRGAGVNDASGSVGQDQLKAFKKKPSGKRDASWGGQGKYK